MKLLVASSWFPYPLDNGSRMRAYHLLTQLSRRHSLTLLSFGVPRGSEDLAPLRALCAALLLLMGQHHIAIVLASFIVNLVIQWVLFRQATRIVAFLGRTGAAAISKVIMLLLAAIAVKMIREGILAILT